ncbi:kinase-like domain-containing protein [Mucor mucedo]|uniref:kinase-like domain-containing protein n=1 Tax=Mucor mucedo TaxID=29922 RepID=UPI00221FC01C|nr:kinase-like domain-containing protein [Mucor mucedo]KAI7890793.1 kinase-like domain-containing protein [Mucor mucedo]
MLRDSRSDRAVKPRLCNIFEDRYRKIEILGKGNFGEVFLAEHVATQRKVAVKVVDTRLFKNDDQRRHAENEKEICKLFQKRYKHPHIVDVTEVNVHDQSIYFVLEYVEGGELYQQIKSKGRIGEPQAKKWFKELVEAVAYIHKHSIVHRDLKPENVLVDKMGKIKLCDFGFGKVFDATKLLDTYCGSPFYAAPEMVTATPYRGPPVDMWSCGVILYAMLTGQLPFHCDTMPELFKKISLAHYVEPNTLSDEALHLIKALLCRNPKRRITAENALKHPWLHSDPPTHHIKKMIKIPSTNTFRKSAIKSNALSISSTLPSPVISVGDEELASYNTTSEQQKTSNNKATAARFILHGLNKKSQVAPTREKNKDSTKKGSRALLVTAERIKRFFSNTFFHRRLTTT